MLGTYGTRFIDMWKTGDDATIVGVKRIWAKRLFQFSPQVLAKALELLDSKPHPPTLPEFITLCHIARDRIKPVHDAHKLLPKMLRVDPNDPATKEARERCLETARNLRMTSVLRQATEAAS